MEIGILLPFLLLSRFFHFLSIFDAQAFFGNAENSSPKLCDSTSHAVGLGTGRRGSSAPSVPKHPGLAASLHSLFNVCSHIRHARRLGKCLTLPSDLRQSIARFLYPCTCCLAVLFQVISLGLVYFSYSFFKCQPFCACLTCSIFSGA